MKDYYINFTPLNIAPDYFFTASDEEIEQTEKREEERAREFERLFFAPDFLAAEYITASGARRILHHSTRAGVLFQLSYLNAEGLPTMHENYFTTDETPETVTNKRAKIELLKHYTARTYREPLTLRIITA
jgi:hypothetical protein